MAYLTLAQVRALPNLSDTAKFTDAEITAAITWFETLFEDYTGVAWEPRTVTDERHYDQHGASLVLDHLRPRTIDAVRAYTTATTTVAFTTAELADLRLFPSGKLTRVSLGSFSSAYRMIAVDYCVDEETQIFTRTGWSRYDALSAGEEVLTLNHETGMSEWQPVLEVCVFPAKRRELILMEGHGHSSLSTPNHRWPVTAPLGRGTQRRWRTTETLVGKDRLVASAPCADLPTVAKWSDAFVELIAWFVTEGTIRPSGAVSITKTLARAGGEHVERIDAAYRNVFGSPIESLMPRSTWGMPHWRRDTKNERVTWALNAVGGDLLTHVAPERVVERSFLYELTQAQLELFIRTAMTDNNGPTRFVQKDRRSAEAFQLAATLAGYGTSLLPRRHSRGTSWNVTLQRREGCLPAESDRVARLQGREFIRRIDHDGIVWCPRTHNGTWLAKRNGSVYFTGNTHGYAAPPADVVEAAKTAIRAHLIDDYQANRQYAVSTEAGIIRTSQPGPDRPFGLPEVDAVANRRSHRCPSVA